MYLETSYCRHVGTCGGCPWGTSAVVEQRRAKLGQVADLGPAVHFADTPALRLRDRADLTWWRDPAGDLRLGLYALDDRAIVDLAECPMMSTELERFFLEYRRRQPPIDRGSVRLRVGPDGARGVWLDFANVDVKTLFDERTYLAWLSELAFVEIGQRRKTLIWVDSAPKLTDPTPRPWFETYDEHGRGIPLYGPVGGFSQSGFAGNRALIDEVARAAVGAAVPKWLELFGGNGNFALALAARGLGVEVVEVDRLAVEGLRESLKHRPGLDVRVHQADAYLRTERLPPVAGRGVIVDPPRSGLKATLGWLERERPPAILYVSCYTDVFRADAAQLKKFGYTLESLVGIDQFAHSPHAEWVALFKV